MIKTKPVLFIAILSMIVFSYEYDIQLKKYLIYSIIPFTGTITEVKENYIIEIENNTIIRLSLIDREINDSQLLKDSTHFISVLCPVRSPVVVYPDLTSNLKKNETSEDNYSNIIDGIVFCTNSKISNDENNNSINEALVKSKLAYIDSNYCYTSSYANQTWPLVFFGCGNDSLKYPSTNNK